MEQCMEPCMEKSMEKNSMEPCMENTIIKDGDIMKKDNEYIFNPYNPNNREITKSEVEMILSNYGLPVRINNLNLFKRAFIHKSYVKRPALENMENQIEIVSKPPNCMTLKTKSNERLEFLGDGILEAITKFYLYKRFPKENEGFMTEKKIALVKNENIGKIAYEMGLHKWYIISKNAEEKKIRYNLKKLGCLFESFLGALFLNYNHCDVEDNEGWFLTLFHTNVGFQMAQVFIENIFEKHIDWTELVNNDNNYKNILQVFIQKNFKKAPIYIEFAENDEEGYHMAVCLCIGFSPDNQVFKNTRDITEFKNQEEMMNELKEKQSLFVCFGKSAHKIKKKAEQMACKLAIDYLENKGFIVKTKG